MEKLKKEKINVLSLFDGMSCGRIALDRAGIKVNKYYAFEIDKSAIKVSKSNYPDIIHLGDIKQWRDHQIENPDIVVSGSPCQGFSQAGKQLNFKDPRSALFFDFVDILNHYQPKYFLMENVVMKKEYQDVISHHLDVEPVKINSSLVSGQNRERLYWFNWDSDMPADQGIHARDIIDQSDKTINPDGWQRWFAKNMEKQLKKKYCHFMDDKAICMTARQVASWNGNLVKHECGIRFLNTVEAERLQTVPDGYTSTVSNCAAYRMLGNGWTVDVIAHILRNMIKQETETEK